MPISLQDVRREIKRAIRDIRLQDTDSIVEIAKMRPIANLDPGGGIITTPNGLRLAQEEIFWFDSVGNYPFGATPDPQRYDRVHSTTEVDQPVTLSTDGTTFTIQEGGVYDITFDETYGVPTGSADPRYAALMYMELNGVFLLGSRGYIGAGAEGVSDARNITTITTDTTLEKGTHDIVLVDASGGAVTVTLPPADEATQFVVKKIDSSGNSVTVDGDGAETIDDAANQVISVQYDSINVASDGSNWHIY